MLLLTILSMIAPVLANEEAHLRMAAFLEVPDNGELVNSFTEEQVKVREETVSRSS